MLRSLALAVFMLTLAGCAPKNVGRLQDDPTGTLSAHSADSVPITAARIAHGMRACVPANVVTQVFSPDQPADVQINTPSAFGGVSVSAHLVPTAHGTDVSVYYKFAAWRKHALEMQTLANGGQPGC